MTAAVVAVTIAAHVRFILVDTRVPRDLGLYYGGVPHAYDLLMGRTPGTLDEWWHTIGQSTGWYHLVLGAVLAVFGRNQDTFQIPDVLWISSLLVLVGRITTRLAGARAALVAVMLVGAMPGVMVAGRTGWLHVPEAVLALVGLWTWMKDPGMKRRWTGLWMGLVGLLAFTLRPSGLVWVGSLAPLVLWSVVCARRAGQRAPWGSAALVVLGWAAGSVVPLLYLNKYLSYKFDARDRYMSTLPDLALQAQMMLGAIPSWVVVLGLSMGAYAAYGLWRARRAGQAVEEGVGAGPEGVPEVGRAATAQLLIWTALVFVLWVGFRAGIDNFTLLCPALAILATLGMERVKGAPGVTLGLIAFVPTVVLQFTPPGGPDSPDRSWPGLREIPSSPHLLNWFRPFDRFGEPELKALVDATCGQGAPPGTCEVVVDQGLYTPFGEEPGYLELFLAGDPRVALLTVRDAPLGHDKSMNALIEYHCGDRDLQWRERWPRSLPNLEALLQQRVLEPVWVHEVGPSCEVLWYTKMGYLPHPELLPAQGRRLLGGQPADPEQLREGPEHGEKVPMLGGPAGMDEVQGGRPVERPPSRPLDRPQEQGRPQEQDRPQEQQR